MAGSGESSFIGVMNVEKPGRQEQEHPKADD
jgi:hypothetical protein